MCEYLQKKKNYKLLFTLRQLVNGDVTMNYRHPGYQRMKNVSLVNRSVSLESEESRWISEVMEVINEVERAVISCAGVG